VHECSSCVKQQLYLINTCYTISKDKKEDKKENKKEETKVADKDVTEKANEKEEKVSA